MGMWLYIHGGGGGGGGLKLIHSQINENLMLSNSNLRSDIVRLIW